MVTKEQPVRRLPLEFVRVEPVIPYLLEALVGHVHDQSRHEFEHVLGDVLPSLFQFLIFDAVVLMGVEEPGDGAVLHVALRDPSFGYRRVGGIPGDIVHQIGYVLGGGFAFGELPSVDIVAELVFVSQFFEEQIHFALLFNWAVSLEIGVNVIEKRIPEGDPKEIEMEIAMLLELAPVVEIPLRDQHMDVRMPFHVSPECVQEVNMTKSSLLLSVRDGRMVPEQRIKGFVY